MDKEVRAVEETPEEEPELETAELSALMGLAVTRELLAAKEPQRVAAKEPPWALL